MVKDRKARFLKIYANLPLGARDEIIVVIDRQPLTWNAVRLEVENDTKKGDQALQLLEELEVLKDE